MSFEKYIDNVPNFPIEGVIFRDISRLLADPKALNSCINEWSARLNYIEKNHNLDFTKIAAIDSRGFIFGGILADRLDKGLVMIRKKGKLPPPILSSESYQLEYGVQELEIKDNLSSLEKIMIVDDVLATGGTVKTAIKLLERTGAEVKGVSCLIQLKYLYGKDTISGKPIYSMINDYEE